MKTKLLHSALSCLLIAICFSSRAATNLGLYVTATKATLLVDFGNPTEYPKIKPDPTSLNLGTNGTYFHGTQSTSLTEIYPTYAPGNNPPYGGPGDSWCTFSLTSPTPGSTRDNPIIFRFDSHITNYNSGVGYWNNGSTSGADRLRWYFDQQATNIHYRVDWTIDFLGLPFIEQRCYFVPPFNFICTNATIASTGKLASSFVIDGGGSYTVYPSSPIGPGVQTYSGTVSGIAINSHLAVSVYNEFYVGQSTRGDAQVITEFRIYADTVPLSPPDPPFLNWTGPSGNSLTLAWPVSAQGYVLQETTDLSPSIWSDVDQIPSVSGTNKVVTISMTNNSGFFRLYKP